MYAKKGNEKKKSRHQVGGEWNGIVNPRIKVGVG